MPLFFLLRHWAQSFSAMLKKGRGSVDASVQSLPLPAFTNFLSRQHLRFSLLNGRDVFFQPIINPAKWKWWKRVTGMWCCTLHSLKSPASWLKHALEDGLSVPWRFMVLPG